MSLLADVSPLNSNMRCLTQAPQSAHSDEPLLPTRNPAMCELYEQIQKVAGVEIPVLFLGESGVGKEHVARLLHQLSNRSSKPFLKVNCAALPSELLESELFGYEAGAFTGATRSKPGQFELCNHGTILLDEIAEMPPAMQAKLLHVLQDKEFSRLGGRQTIQVNVRILAATNVNIEEALAVKKFRADLYYRLNTFVFHVPPLRERPEDIPYLLEHFISETAAHFGMAPKPVSHRVLNACLEYAWPGNVRELQSFVCRFLLREDEELLLGNHDTTPPEDGIEELCEEDPDCGQLGLKNLTRQIRIQAEKLVIKDTLARTCWNRTEAARQLKISYKSLRNKIRQYGISAHPEAAEPPDKISSSEKLFGQTHDANTPDLSSENLHSSTSRTPHPAAHFDYRKLPTPISRRAI